jgi:uncharacterized phiE125 gp8 family phage protein
MASFWSIKRLTSPSVLPVSLVQAKEHLRLSPSDTTHDDQLTLLIEAATERLEQDLDRQIIDATYTQYQLGWNELDEKYGEIKLYRKSINAVTSVKYIDPDGNQVTLDPSDYVVDLHRSCVFPAVNTEWPVAHWNHPSAVEVTFQAGYGSTADTVPRLLKSAILLCVGKWFFDPAQEGSALHSQEVAYERIISLLGRSSYP